jgi:hypothetical protein
MSKTIEIKCKVLTRNIFTSHTGKYTYHQIVDYSSGE